MPGPLEARLLFASRIAYQIPVPVPDAPPMVPPAAYGLTNVVSISVGPDNINAALVADADEGVVIAFRGTFSPTSPDHAQTVLDWLNDGDAVLVKEPGLPGLVHQGFRDSLNGLWPWLKDTLAARAAARPAAPVYVTGHSKGGAIAYLAAIRCQAAVANPVFVCSFAAARPGDQDFADSFDATVQHAIRYEYADDIVPHVPPENALRLLLQKLPVLSGLHGASDGFVSPGNLAYLPRGSTTAMTPQGDSPALELRRIGSIVECAITFRFETIVTDHSIDAGFGYATAITGGT